MFLIAALIAALIATLIGFPYLFWSYDAASAGQMQSAFYRLSAILGAREDADPKIFVSCTPKIMLHNLQASLKLCVHIVSG
jgi:hypothetical protein